MKKVHNQNQAYTVLQHYHQTLKKQQRYEEKLSTWHSLVSRRCHLYANGGKCTLIKCTE